DHPRLDPGHGRLGPVVHDATRPRGRPVLQEVEADPVDIGEQDVPRGNAGLASPAGDQPTQRVVGQPGHPGTRPPEPGQADGRVHRAPAYLDIQAVRLFQPAEVCRGQADHGLAEGDDIHGWVGPRWDSWDDWNL